MVGRKSALSGNVADRTERSVQPQLLNSSITQAIRRTKTSKRISLGPPHSRQHRGCAGCCDS
jgi:hypothetical protein